MPLIELQNVSKSFGKTKILERLNASFPARGLVVIHGASGSGKSTLLNLLCGMDKPTSGSLRFEGLPLEKQSPKELALLRRSCMGRVFQHYELIADLDALTNIMLPLFLNGETLSVAQKRGEELLGIYGLQDCAKKKVASVSGGEKQRLAIIRSIIHRPSVLFADEPTGALDRQNAQIVSEMLLEYSKNALVIVVTHDLNLFKNLASAIFCLHDQTLDVEKPFEGFDIVDPKFQNHSKRAGESFWPTILAKSHLAQRKKINAIGIVASGIALASCLLTLGFASGSSYAIVEASQNFLDVGTASVSKVSKTIVEGSPLTLMQSLRPSVSEMAQLSGRFKSMRFEVDLSPLFSGLQGEYDGQVISSFYFCPLRNFDFSSSQKGLLAEGTFPNIDTFDTIIINREMERILKLDKPDISLFETPIYLTSQGIFDLADQERPSQSVKETFSFTRAMRIAAIVEETSFLNEPRIFYSHRSACAFLQDCTLPLYSELIGHSVTWLDVLEEASPNAVLSSYRYLVFLKSETDLEALYALSQKEYGGTSSFEISSFAFTNRTALTGIGEVLRIALIFFVLISLLGSVFVLGISGYSSFISKIKESAILSSMGATLNEIRSIFMRESLFVGILSAAVGVLLSIPTQHVLNQFFLTNLGIGHPIRIPFSNFLGFPFSLLFLVFIISIGLSLLATGFPIAIFHRGNLVAFLRDE